LPPAAKALLWKVVGSPDDLYCSRLGIVFAGIPPEAEMNRMKDRSLLF
jgi:hypothetical protein